MANLRIEMDPGNGWEVRTEGEFAGAVADIAASLAAYAIQYPHRAVLDGVMVAVCLGGRRRRPSVATP